MPLINPPLLRSRLVASWTIALAWNAPGATDPDPLSQQPNEGNGYRPITDYIVEYCESDSAGNCTGSWTTYNDGVSIDAGTSIVGFPASPTAYYGIRVSAVNEVGASQASGVSIVQTSSVSLATSSDAVTISINPSGASTFSSISHTVTISSNTGCNVFLSMIDANQNLTSGTNSLIPTTALANSPVLDLPTNSWGYRLNNATFGNTTTIENNVSNSQYTWAQVRPRATPDNIFTGTGSNTFPVYYGVKVDTTQPASTYTGTVRYTAVTN